MPPAFDMADRTATAGLLDNLRNLRRRIKLLSVLYGMGIVLAAAVGLLLAVVLLDYLIPLPAIPRAILNGATLVVVGYVLIRWVVRPALARLTLSDLAGRIESTFPQFDDSLRSTVYFSNSEIPGSVAMQRKTIERATQVASGVDMSQAVTLKPVWTSLGGGIAALVVLVLVAILAGPDLRAIAADRLFAGNAAWPKRVNFLVDGDTPARVPAGQDVTVKMRVTKGSVKHATVRYRYDNGAWRELTVPVQSDGTFMAQLKAELDHNREAGNLQIKVEAGDDEKEVANVTVVPQLQLINAVAVVTPPAYAGTHSEPISAIGPTLEVLAGSDVAVTFEFNRPLINESVSVAQVEQHKGFPKPTWAFPKQNIAVATLHFGTDAVRADAHAFTVSGMDIDKFRSKPSGQVRVLVRKDTEPRLTIENPAEKTEDRTADAYVPLRATAEDDYNFAFVNLEIRGEGGTLGTFKKSIPLYGAGYKPAAGVNWKLAADSTPQLKRYSLEYQWELKELGVALKPGDKLTYWLQGRDNFELPGESLHQDVQSEHHTIVIISQADLAKAMEAKAAVLLPQIEDIKKSVDTNKVTAEEQAKAARERKKFDEAQRATAARLAEQQASLKDQTSQVSQQLKEMAQTLKENRAPNEGIKKAAEKASEKLDNAANSPMKEAANKLDEAKDQKSDPKASAQKQQENANKAAENLDQAAQQQGEASKQLEDAKKELGEFGGLQTAIQKLEDILKKQKEVASDFKKAGKDMLGKKPSDLTKEQKEKLKELVDKQDDLANQTDKAIQETKEKGEKLEKADPTASQAMKEAAQSGQQQGIPKKQSNKQDQNGAAQQMDQNQQANAQQKHKEIELGLEMMVDKLKAAERAKLEKLTKDLADVKKLLDALVAAQAGINIDNLIIQNKLDASFKSKSDLETLFQQAQRDIKARDQLKPDIDSVSADQAQNYRNAVATVAKAKVLPDAKPAGLINDAATKMEQAVVYLKQDKLADAYQPPQVEALAKLLAAKKLIDEAKNKADQEKKDREQESIRQAYVKMLEEQKKIDGETKRLDGVKDPEGQLKREDSIVLRNLPDKQGELSKKATELGEKLAALDSVVYKWANKDIINSMGEVKDDLAKPRTDVVVQTQQTRIEEQLEAMIENLKKRPPQKNPFEGRQAGGGGGGGQKPPPKVPTDAELRLLRDLQLAVNKATTIIDGQVKAAGGKKDEQKLTGLGGRQGELRTVFKDLIEKASQGKLSVSEEPDDKVQLPEEASKDDIEAQEFIQDLLKNDKMAGAPEIERIVKQIGDRTGRSRQRLVKYDPGNVTQEIQKRAIQDIENLIAVAQQQQAQSGGKPQPGEGEDGQQPKPGSGAEGAQAQGQGKQPGQPQQNNGNTAAADSAMTGGLNGEDLSKPMEQIGQAGWGSIFHKDRGPTRAGGAEKHAPKYDKYISDYYKELARKAAENK